MSSLSPSYLEVYNYLLELLFYLILRELTERIHVIHINDLSLTIIISWKIPQQRNGWQC